MGTAFRVVPIRKKTPQTLDLRHKKRATDGARTRGLHLGKVALYQLSYCRIVCFRTTKVNILKSRHVVNKIFKKF